MTSNNFRVLAENTDSKTFKNEIDLCHSERVNYWERYLEERQLVICVLRPPCPFLANSQLKSLAEYAIYAIYMRYSSIAEAKEKHRTCLKTGMPVTVATSLFTWFTV